MKLLFIVNPISGGVDKEPFLNEAKLLLEKYGIGYQLYFTTGDGDTLKLEKVLASYIPDRVVSVGGDGTTLFTSILLKGSEIPMGIVPLGSANGMAEELNVNSRPIEALKDIILSDVTAGLDMVLVNDKYYSIHIGDVGMNASIVEAYDKDENRGMITYAKYFIDELKQLSPFEIVVKADGKTVVEKGVMVAICNSRKYGSGVPLNTIGNPFDGKFEIVIITDIGLNSLLKAGLSKFDDVFFDDQNSKLLTTSKAEIIFDKPRLLQLDGEVIGKFDKLKVEIIKSAVKFITHKNNVYLS